MHFRTGGSETASNSSRIIIIFEIAPKPRAGKIKIFAVTVSKMAKPYVYLEATFHDEQQALLEKVFNIVWPATLEQHRSKVSAVVVAGYPKITAEFLDSLPAVKVIGNHGVGYDHIDVEACQSRGVRVGITPGVLSDAAADMAFALLLASARRVVEGDQTSKNPLTKGFDMNWFGYQVSGATIGIIGMGRIGFEIAKRSKGFGMKVFYHNRTCCPKEVEEAVQATYMPTLLDLLKCSDYVVLGVPGSKDNFKMIGRAEFAAMKKNSIFINIARGNLVDQDALLESLSSGHLAAAGLDVTDPEPLPRDHPLLAQKNVIITPHTGMILCDHGDSCSSLSSQYNTCLIFTPQVVQPFLLERR